MKKIVGVSQKRTKKSRYVVFDVLEVKKYLEDKYKIEFSNLDEDIKEDSDDDDSDDEDSDDEN